MRKGSGLVLLLVLIAILLYGIWPVVSDQLARSGSWRSIDSYRQSMAEMPEEQRESYLLQAQAARFEEMPMDPFDEDLQAGTPPDGLPTVDGVMGVLEIPRLGVSLPICRQAYWRTLKIGSAHIANTSLPVGGKGNHCALAGWSDKRSARFLKGLDRLAPGDIFKVEALGKTLTYEVDGITWQASGGTLALERDMEQSLCSLVTEQDGRLLVVRGHQTDEHLKAKQDLVWELPLWTQTLLFALPFLALGCLMMLVIELAIRALQTRRMHKMFEQNGRGMRS